jgi:hypothetical protein
MFDPEKFGEAMGAAIREAVTPLLKRIEILESRESPKPDFSAAISEEVEKRVAALPAPKDGDHGKSITIDDVRPMLDEAVKAMNSDVRETLDAAIKAIPIPKDGNHGESVTVEDVAPMIRAEVEKSIAAIPAPKDGLGLAGAMIDRDGVLQITLTNGEVKSLGVVVGKDGADFTDASFEYDGERMLTINSKSGSIVKRLPIPMDKGYYRAGMPAFEKGDIVTHEGSAWIALRETKARPGSDVKEDWRLFVRKGRDGESIVKTVNGAPAAPIKLKS